MTLFEEHMQFANDVLRIREAMHNNTFDQTFKMFTSFSMNFKMKNAKLNFPGAAFQVGDVNTHKWEPGDTKNAFTVITTKSIVFIDKDTQLVSILGKELELDIVQYTEDLHFQHSLLYSDEELRARVVLGALKNQKIENGYRFKVFWYYVPILAKLLRYKDNGII